MPEGKRGYHWELQRSRLALHTVLITQVPGSLLFPSSPSQMDVRVYTRQKSGVDLLSDLDRTFIFIDGSLHLINQTVGLENLLMFGARISLLPFCLPLHSTQPCHLSSVLTVIGPLSK